MKTQTIQHKALLKNRVFSCCGLFSVKSGLFSIKSGIGAKQIAKAKLFATVPMPNWCLAYKFMPYRIPYDWLTGTPNRTRGSELNKGPANAHSKNSGTRREQRTQNSLRSKSINIFNKILVNSGIQNISHIKALSNCFYGFFLDSVKESSANLEQVPCSQGSSTYKRIFRTGLSSNLIAYNLDDIVASIETQTTGKEHAPREGAGGISGRVSEKIGGSASNWKVNRGVLEGLTDVGRANETLIKRTIQREREKAKAGMLFDTRKLHRKFIEKNSATATKSKTGERSDLHIEHEKANTRLQARKIDLHQDAIQRTIKTFASKDTEARRENRAQFSKIQAQLKTSEQQGNQEIRRLQQTVLELKNVLSARNTPVATPPARPPSMYGRLK